MRTFLLLVTILSATAHAESDGSAHIAVGSSMTALAAAELLAAVGLFGMAGGERGLVGDILTGSGAVCGGLSLVTAAIAAPILVTGLNRHERFRKARVSLAATAGGAMVGFSGAF